MNERRLVLLGYGFVFGAVSVSVCRAYPGAQIEALCLVAFSAFIAFLVTEVLFDALKARKRR